MQFKMGLMEFELRWRRLDLRQGGDCWGLVPRIHLRVKVEYTKRQRWFSPTWNRKKKMDKCLKYD